MSSRTTYRKRRPRPGHSPAANRCVVYLDDEDLRSLKITASELGLSRSHTIQQAIRAFCIDRHARKVER